MQQIPRLAPALTVEITLLRVLFSSWCSGKRFYSFCGLVTKFLNFFPGYTLSAQYHTTKWCDRANKGQTESRISLPSSLSADTLLGISALPARFNQINSRNQFPTYLPSGDKDYQVDVPQDLPGRENQSLFPMRYPIYDVICWLILQVCFRFIY